MNMPMYDIADQVSVLDLADGVLIDPRYDIRQCWETQLKALRSSKRSRCNYRRTRHSGLSIFSPLMRVVGLNAQ